LSVPSSELLSRGAACQANRQNAAHVRRGRSTLVREQTSSPLGRQLAGAFVAIALTMGLPCFSLAEDRADESRDVNAPWEDLLSALGRRGETDDVPRSTGPRSEPERSGEADTRGPMSPPRSVHSPTAEEMQPSPPFAERAPSLRGRENRQSETARRRPEREEGLARARKGTRDASVEALPQRAETKRSRVERQRRSRPALTRVAREQRQMTSASDQVAIDADLQMPPGLIPKHATRRE
jgi:hypothetical protein